MANNIAAWPFGTRAQHVLNGRRIRMESGVAHVWGSHSGHVVRDWHMPCDTAYSPLASLCGRLNAGKIETIGTRTGFVHHN